MAKQQILFGIHSIQEALEAGKNIEKVLLRKDKGNDQSGKLHALLRKAKIPIQYVPDERLNRLTSKNHQGAIAFISIIEYTELEMLIPSIYDTGKAPFLLMLDGVTDVRNFGSICRTAECAGVQGVIIPSRGAAQINADAVQTSAGALTHLPVCRVENLSESIDYLKNSGIKVVAATEKTNQHHFDTDFASPVVIILGAEDKGISGALLEKADESIKIPLMGKINSLNVSNAAAVVMYEALRQRLAEQ